MFKPCRSLLRRRLKSLNWVSKIPKWVRSLTKISKLLKTSQSLKRIQGLLLNPQRKEMLILILYTLSSSTKTNWVTITTIPMKWDARVVRKSKTTQMTSSPRAMRSNNKKSSNMITTMLIFTQITSTQTRRPPGSTSPSPKTREALSQDRAPTLAKTKIIQLTMEPSRALSSVQIVFRDKLIDKLILNMMTTKANTQT